jgi:LPXTG-site transpeptidase (sortase) family protein
MTAVEVPAADAAEPPPSAEPSDERPLPRLRSRQPAGRAQSVAQAAGASLLILAFTALGFVAWVGLFSGLHYDKAQLNAYDTLRVQLASGTAPNGPLMPNDPSKLLPMGSPVAVLSIPAIRLRTVILQGTTGAVLENGPGHLRDTPMPGQVGISVILGRQSAYGGPFGGLASLAPGDSIEAVTGQVVASYRVIDLRRAGDPLPDPVATGGGRMILVTADGSPLVPTGILYVDAELTSKPQPSPGVVQPSYIAPSENAMAADPQAWLTIVLWGQGLVLVAVTLSWLWSAWGKWQTWLIAVPVVGFIVLSVADQATRLLPNLL